MPRDTSVPHVKRQAAGFTLIELIITIAVLAILIAFALPSFKGIISNNGVTNNYYDLMGALRNARSEAVTRGSPVSVTASDTDWSEWHIVTLDGETLRSHGDRDARYQIKIEPAGTTEVKFTARGTTDTAVCFQLDDSDMGDSSKKMFITVPKSGSIHSLDSCP